MRYNNIVIEGNIGAGKTSLATMLAERLGAKLILEQFAENPFLPGFYENPHKYAFPLELSFLAERYQQLKDVLNSRDLFQKYIVSDYYFSKSLIFAKNNLEDDEFKLFARLFNIISPLLPKPDILVYLYLDIEDLQSNIKKRGREYEQSINNEYLENIQRGYFNLFRQENGIKILVVNTGNYDFVNNHESYHKLIDIIDKDYSDGINRAVIAY